MHRPANDGLEDVPGTQPGPRSRRQATTNRCHPPCPGWLKPLVLNPDECCMIQRTLILTLVVLAGCSGAAPAVERAEPSAILLPSGPDPAPDAMFIGELAGSSTNEGNTWLARAAVMVLDGANQPVAGAVVSGKWSEGDSETTSCLTDETGSCEMERNSIRKRVSHAVLEITKIEHGSLTYFPEFDQVDNPEDQPRFITIRKP